MKDKLRELAERWKAYDGYVAGKRDALSVCADELLHAVDAEGDGGAVPVGYADPLSMQGYTLGQYGDFCVGDKSSVRSVPLYDRPHPARSGVVRDEDVRILCEKFDDMGYGYPRTEDARAALEHFAKGSDEDVRDAARLKETVRRAEKVIGFRRVRFELRFDPLTDTDLSLIDYIDAAIQGERHEH